MGVAYKTIGNYEDAINSFLKCIELGLKNADVYYNLARALQSCGRNSDANKRKKNSIGSYDRFGFVSLIDTIKQNYDYKNLSRFTKQRFDSSDRHIFIVGMPRSGTSLIEQILSSHPNVFGAGELTFWVDFIKKHPLEFAHANFNEDMLQNAENEYINYVDSISKQEHTILRVIDKLPGNYINVGLIHAVFPNARFIHTMRNPIDTCLSIYFQNFNPTHRYANDLEDLAHYYKEYHRLMQHWKSVLPEGVMLDVRYEDIVEDQEGWSKKIIEHIGLEWDEKCLEFHKTKRKVGTASNWLQQQQL